MAKQVKKWITINGNHVPVYEDGSLGGIGAKLQGNKKAGGKTEDISPEEDQKQLDDLESKRDNMYSVIKDVQSKYGDDDDGYAEEIMEQIIEDNGHDLSDDEIRELAAQYYEDEDEDWQDRVGDDQEEYYEDEDDPNVIARNNADAKLDEIAERYNTSKPVSGDWDTEVAHEQAAIAEELGISKEEAKQLMKDKLGFTDDQFDDAETKASRVEIYKRQLEDVQDQLDLAPKSKALRDEKAIAELEKKKAELESYIERDEEMPFQSKGLSKEEKAEDWAKETQKDIAAKKANIKEMGYAEAGQFISDHKEEFGLSDDDDAYQIAAQIKNGDIKLDKDGKVSKADRDKVSEGLKAMDKAAKERGDYVEADDADITAERVGKKGSKSLEDHPDIQKIAEDHVKKIWNGGAANRELYDAADKWAEEHNFDKTKARDAAFAAMNKKQMAEIKRRESEKGFVTADTTKYEGQNAPEFVPRVKGDGNQKVTIGEQEYHTEPLHGGYNKEHPGDYIEGHTYVPHNNFDAKSFFVANDGTMWHDGSQYLTTRSNERMKKEYEASKAKEKSIKIGDKQVGVSKDPHAAEKVASAKKMVANNESNLAGLRDQLKKHPNDEHTAEIKAAIKKAEGRVKDSKNTLAEREGKSINIGGKKVGVSKTTTEGSIKAIRNENGSYSMGDYTISKRTGYEWVRPTNGSRISTKQRKRTGYSVAGKTFNTLSEAKAYVEELMRKKR